MTRLDTIEFTTNTDFIRSMDRSYFTVANIDKPNGKHIVSYSLNNKKLGINRIIVNETSHTVVVSVSSKILGLNYSQGICLDTLDEFIDEVNSKALVLDKEFISDCTLKKADIKSDLNLINQPYEYINTLNQLIAPKFTKTKYLSGIVFNECIKTSPIRYTGYGKEYEMQLSKSFYNKYPQLVGDFDNVLRIETRLSKPLTIRKYIGSNQFLDVFKSSNLNYQILDKIICNQTKFNPLMNTQHLTNIEEKNYAQIYYLNELYHGDFHSIIRHIKNKLGKNTKASYNRKQVLEYLAMINNANDGYSKENIEEIKAALKESAQCNDNVPIFIR